MDFLFYFRKNHFKMVTYFVELGMFTWDNSLIYGKFKSSSWLAQPFELQSIIYLYSPEQKDICA